MDALAPDRLGTSLGPAIGALVHQLLDSFPHPEQGYRACLGLFRLDKRYGAERLERACARALAVGAPRYRSVQSILLAGLDRLPPDAPAALVLPSTHAHLRGAAYYATLTLGDPSC